MLFGNQKKIDVAVPVGSSGSPVSMRQVLAHLKVSAFWLSVSSVTVPVCTSACARVAASVSRVNVFWAHAPVGTQSAVPLSGRASGAAFGAGSVTSPERVHHRNST